MKESLVYFTDLRTKPGHNLLDKLEKLIKKANIDSIDFTKKFTAIKIHFGEPGNLAYIRPNYAGCIAKFVKSKGGIPFLTDANTLYKGRRDNAVNHIESAFENGFSPFSVFCPVIIADGLKGLDYREIEINMKNCKTAKIGSAIADADIIISMNHFKGHELTGFGGAIKNLGMGSGSIGGKLEMHSNSKPFIKTKNCVGCKICENNCSKNAIKVNSEKKAVINYDLCVGCGQCIAVCQYNAASVSWDGKGNSVYEKIVEYAYAVIKNKPHFHINFIMNVSPNCDCWSNNDAPIVPDIGILASFDPVAIDCASVDLVNKSIKNNNTILDNIEKSSDFDKFTAVHPSTNWSIATKYAEEIGLGSTNYKLITI